MTMRRGRDNLDNATIYQQEDVTKAMMQRNSTERNEHKQQNHEHNNHPELSMSHTIFTLKCSIHKSRNRIIDYVIYYFNALIIVP